MARGLNARVQQNGEIVARWGPAEWAAILAVVAALFGFFIRNEARLTKTETILENTVKVMDRLEDNLTMSRNSFRKIGDLENRIKKIDSNVSKIPERGEAKHKE